VQALTGLQHDGQQRNAGTVGEGFALTVPAGKEARTLVIYALAHRGIGRLTAELSDQSATPYAANLDPSVRNDAFGIFTLRYAANADGERLNVRLVLITDNSSINSANVTIQAASLAATPDPPLALVIQTSAEPWITVSGPPGTTNRIEFSRELEDPVWESLMKVVLPGTGTISFGDPTAAAPQGFYRAVPLD